MKPVKIGLRELETFLGETLPEHLITDLCDLRMVKEADLECCVYHHIRNFLDRDKTWKFLARRYSRHTDHFIDILVFRKGKPRIAIELKWNRASISKKDRESLRRSISKLGVNRAYFITTIIGAKDFHSPRKTATEKNRLFEITIPLPLAGVDLQQWKANRKKYTSRMSRR